MKTDATKIVCKRFNGENYKIVLSEIVLRQERLSQSIGTE
jgi:hypothetical protein